jgi:hypothetical protein
MFVTIVEGEMRKRTEYFFEKCLANTMFSDAEVKVG